MRIARCMHMHVLRVLGAPGNALQLRGASRRSRCFDSELSPLLETFVVA